VYGILKSLIISSLARSLSTKKISSKDVRNFWSCIVLTYTEIDVQTDRQAADVKHVIIRFVVGVGYI